MQKKSIFFNQKGATAVEFAIVLSLLLTLIFGIIEFGLVMFNRQVITNAAREGARAGIIVRPARLSDDEIKAVVLNYSAQHLVTFGDDVLTADDVVIPVRCLTFQCDLEVQVNYVYDFLFLSNIGIGPLNLRATTVMNME
jgi:TadE-like protein